MGFKISWIGFDGTGKAAALVKLGLVDTGEPDEANEAPFSGAEIPGNWFILFANDFGFVSHERLAELSGGCRVVACQVHEGIMVSASYAYENGRRLWELVHDAQESIDHLSVLGSPPPSFESIRQRELQNQRTASGVDYIFDVPLEVAVDLCNYRHDKWRFNWGEPRFTKLVPAPRRLHS